MLSINWFIIQLFKHQFRNYFKTHHQHLVARLPLRAASLRHADAGCSDMTHYQYSYLNHYLNAPVPDYLL